MRKNWTAILNVLICFFSVFGVLVFLFFVRGFFPDSGGLVGMSLFHILLCMGIAFVLTLSHAVIASEYLVLTEQWEKARKPLKILGKTGVMR